MKKNINVYDITIAVLAVIMAVSVFMIVRGIVIGKREQSEFDDIAALVTTPVLPEQSETEQPSTEAVTQRDISAVLASNSECVGWIYVSGTVINYPVMHTPAEPEKYLHLSFYGKYSNSGTPFIDARCDAEGGMNTIVYGHNMKNGTMFHQLKRYRNMQYTNDNPIIEYQTANGIKKYKIFAVCDVEGNDAWYSFVGDVNEVTYNAKISYIKGRNLFETGITPVYPQKIITLSTCRDGSDSGRLLVLGVETE